MSFKNLIRAVVVCGCGESKNPREAKLSAMRTMPRGFCRAPYARAELNELKIESSSERMLFRACCEEHSKKKCCKAERRFSS